MIFKQVNIYFIIYGEATMTLVQLPPLCKGRQVIALLIALDGSVYVGSNGVDRPQTVCPRTEAGFGRGEGWELCRTICGQTCHAEEAVIEDAGANAAGGTLYLIGHDTVCEKCKEHVKAFGIGRVVIVG
jgi:deoxycytidylate deaminase